MRASLASKRTLGSRAAIVVLSLLAAVAAPTTLSAAAAPAVLLVGPAGTPGAQYISIQDAVNHANAGDWILVAAGVYHEKGSDSAGVLITKPGIHLRGMDRNGVIVDGTNVAPGNNTPTTLPAGSDHCSADEARQDFGPVQSGSPGGRNGIEVKGTDEATHAKFLADGVSIDNLTVCNYLSSDPGKQGNEIWWNGGDGSGEIGMGAFSGSYLNTTVTYYKNDFSAQGKYGIFTSNEQGPGVIDNTYSSNFADSDYYIGACPDCNVILSNAHAQYAALGYSGTNGSGHVQIINGVWDNNKTGIAPNTLNNDDAPSPQTGACANPPAGAPGCFVIKGNHVFDNNNVNVPQSGKAAIGPVGTGILLSGTKFDYVTGNVITGNKAWGVVANDYPDQGPAPAVASCSGGVQTTPTGPCYYVSEGNVISDNPVITGNGGYGQTGNGDLGNASTAVAHPNCFQNNNSNRPMNSDPGCPAPASAPTTLQLLCDSGAVFDCAPAISYPKKDGRCTAPAVWRGGDPTAQNPQGACILPLTAQTTMPDPCAGVPVNAYCPAAVAPAATARVIVPGTPKAGRGPAPQGGPLAPAALLALAVTLVLALVWRLRPRSSGSV